MSESQNNHFHLDSVAECEQPGSMAITVMLGGNLIANFV